MEAEAPSPARHTVQGLPAQSETRAAGSAHGNLKAESEAEAAGFDLAWARHQQNMRDKKVRASAFYFSFATAERSLR
jgi:hypothetical protein